MQIFFAAYGVIGTLSLLQFHILLSNFSVKAMHLPKQIVVAYVMNLPIPLMTQRFSSHQ